MTERVPSRPRPDVPRSDAETEHLAVSASLGVRLLDLVLFVLFLVFTVMSLFPPSGTHFLPWLTVPFGALASLSFLRRAFDARPRLLVDGDGITDRTSLTGGTARVPWSQVVGFSTSPFSGAIQVRVRDPAEVRRHADPLRRISLLVDRIFGRKDVTIAAAPLGVDRKALGTELERALGRAERRELGFPDPDPTPLAGAGPDPRVPLALPLRPSTTPAPRPRPERERPMSGRDPTDHPALTDPTTGLPNRLHFDTVCRYLFEAADRGVALAALMISVDAVGGEAGAAERLARVGEAFRRMTRAADLVAHLGDGRFVVLLIGTNRQGARVAADRLEEVIGPVAAALSIGVASYRPEMESSSELLDGADAARRAAERRGGGVEMA